MTVAAAPTVVTLETDRSLADLIESAVRAAGARSIIVKEDTSLRRALDDWPELVIVDLAADWQEPVRRAKSLPHTKRIPIIAFASHEDPGALPRCTRDRLRIRPTTRTLHRRTAGPAPTRPPPVDALDRGLGCRTATTPLPRRRTVQLRRILGVSRDLGGAVEGRAAARARPLPGCAADWRCVPSSAERELSGRRKNAAPRLASPARPTGDLPGTSRGGAAPGRPRHPRSGCRAGTRSHCGVGHRHAAAHRFGRLRRIEYAPFITQTSTHSRCLYALLCCIMPPRG